MQEFEVSSATVELAAQALNVKGQRIAKTLSFHVDDHVVLIVAAGDAKIANPKYKAQFHTKAKMLSHEEAETLIGHAVGGVCPFAVNACGSSNSASELTIPELEANCDHFQGWVDVCKIPEE